MTQEGWDFITAHWGDGSEAIQSEIARFKEEDTIAMNNAAAEIQQYKDKVLEMTQQNVDLNKTNLNLILRLTDPSMKVQEEDDQETKFTPPSLSDLDAFIVSG